MGELKKAGSAESIRQIMVLAHEAATNTLHFHIRILKHYQISDLIQTAKSYLLDNGKHKSICFKLCAIDTTTLMPVIAFTDPIDMQVECVYLDKLPFETKLFLIELIEKL